VEAIDIDRLACGPGNRTLSFFWEEKMKMLRRIKRSINLLACVTILVSAQSFALAQGARIGYTTTDRDDPGGVLGNRVYRIDLDNPGNTVQMGLTNVRQGLEGLFSNDNGINSRLFGVPGAPDITGTQDPSFLVDLTAAACRADGLGSRVCLDTGILFGRKFGAAWDHTTNTVFLVASDDLNPAAGTNLYEISTTNCMAILRSNTPNVVLDGLAVGGDGTLYATDGRITDSLYKYNYDTEQFELVGPFGVALNEDTGLANYRGVSGTETNLYMITEGDGANPGRLWRVNHTTGAITLVGELRFPDGTEVPEDLEGFDIPWRPLACN
jgi:hypothetical protein